MPIVPEGWLSNVISTLRKKTIFFYKEILNGAVVKSYITDGLLIYEEIICASPHILGSPSSYMTLQRLLSVISLYMRKIRFSFLSVYRGSYLRITSI